ncbi:hypothetical protein BHE74_00045245 [Ensete ventricosum]|nr:hypothetical protein BHE74_00045245 [Ensete ventricosum]
MLPLSLTHRTDVSSIADGWIRRSSFHVQFPSLPLLPCAAPSTVNGEDRRFICHRRTHLKLPSPTMSPSEASTVIVVVV